MSEKTKGINNFSVYDENPFVKQLVIPTKTKNQVIATKNGDRLVNVKSGEVQDDTLFLAIKKKLDKEQFVKLFHSQIKALFDLSPAGIKVFGYLMNQTNFNGAKVEFNWEECAKFTGYKSTSTISKGLTELLNAEFIARTPKTYFYYINPEIFFKGDRLVIVSEYRVAKTDEISENQGSLFDAHFSNKEEE